MQTTDLDLLFKVTFQFTFVNNISSNIKANVMKHGVLQRENQVDQVSLIFFEIFTIKKILKSEKKPKNVLQIFFLSEFFIFLRECLILSMQILIPIFSSQMQDGFILNIMQILSLIIFFVNCSQASSFCRKKYLKNGNLNKPMLFPSLKR